MKSLLAESMEREVKNYATPASIPSKYLRAPIWYSLCCISDSPGSGTGLKKSRHHKLLLNKKINQYTWLGYCQKPRVQLSIFESYICRGKELPKRKKFVTDAFKNLSQQETWNTWIAPHWLWKQPLFHLGAMEALCLLPSWSFRFLSPRVLRLTLGIWFLRESGG